MEFIQWQNEHGIFASEQAKITSFLKQRRQVAPTHVERIDVTEEEVAQLKLEKGTWLKLDQAVMARVNQAVERAVVQSIQRAILGAEKELVEYD
jgi:hypothetical protein